MGGGTDFATTVGFPTHQIDRVDQFIVWRHGTRRLCRCCGRQAKQENRHDEKSETREAHTGYYECKRLKKIIQSDLARNNQEDDRQ